MFLDIKFLLRMHPEMLLFGNEIVHFLLRHFYRSSLLRKFKKLSVCRHQQNKTDNFLRTEITGRFLFLLQNGHSLLCYIRIFSKGYYYEHTFMILTFIEVASSENGVGMGGGGSCNVQCV